LGFPALIRADALLPRGSHHGRVNAPPRMAGLLTFRITIGSEKLQVDPPTLGGRKTRFVAIPAMKEVQMTEALHIPAKRSLLGQFLQLMRNATLERMVLSDVDGQEIDEWILLESHLVRTPPTLFAAQKAPFL